MSVKQIEGPGKKKLEHLLKTLGKKQVKVGWFKENRYKKSGIPVAAVAAINEFGYPPKNIPSRDFIRQTIRNYQPLWKKIAEKGAKEIVKGNRTEEEMLQLIGDKAAAHIQNTIVNGSFEPLKESTIKNRLNRFAKKQVTSSLMKPLIDTTLMIDSVHAVVESI